MPAVTETAVSEMGAELREGEQDIFIAEMREPEDL